MRLFIAEKPSLGRAIADVLPLPHKNKKTHIICGNGDVVAWCAGHILSLADPEEYSPAYAKWSLEPLPIIPKDWKYNVTIKELYLNIISFLKQATVVVNAGDNDRAGQRLVDEVIEHAGYSGKVMRILISDMNPDAVVKSLANLKSNSEFKNLSDSENGRSRADWLYGINMTRLYTVMGQNGGYSGVLSVGRVQTPLLGIIVRRDEEIDNFKSKPFYTLVGVFNSGENKLKANWKIGERAENYLDSEGRLIKKDFADALCAHLKTKPAFIKNLETKKLSESPPLPFSLATIQMEAAKLYGFDAKKTLDICQSLYETHKMTCYPRTDCAYLPEGHLAEINDVIKSIQSTGSYFDHVISNADFKLVSKAWNDKKITAHHAIIPTKKISSAKLSTDEDLVYKLIATRYLLQFYGPFIYNKTTLEITVDNEIFILTGKQILNSGWRSIYNDKSDDDEESDENNIIPTNLIVGDSIGIQDISVVSKKTTAPKRFTNETIIKAMNNAASFVENPQIKKILKDTDGLGTPATQGAIIETLFKRGFIEEKGKNIFSTQTGKSLVNSLPKIATTPDMTAFWESALSKIESGALPLDSFISVVTKQLTELIQDGKRTGTVKIAGVETFKCKRAGCLGVMSRRNGKDGFWWGCSEYGNGCKETFSDKGGKPVKIAKRRS